MPSASTVYAAFSDQKAFQETRVKATSGGVQAEAQRLASIAGESMRALEPLVGDEAERLAAEAQGYVDGQTPAVLAAAYCGSCDLSHDVWGWWRADGRFEPEEPERLRCPGCLEWVLDVQRLDLGEAA